MTRKLPGILLFSAVEVAGLALWLLLVDGGQHILGLVMLFAALFIEHVITDNVIHGRGLFNIFGDLAEVQRRRIVGEIAVFSAVETAIWAGWLALWGIDPIVAVTFLAVALVIEHTVSRNVHERRGLVDKIIDLEVVPHTVVETAVCSVWLVLVRSGNPLAGVILLLVGSIIEHAIAISATKQP